MANRSETDAGSPHVLVLDLRTLRDRSLAQRMRTPHALCLGTPDRAPWFQVRGSDQYGTARAIRGTPATIICPSSLAAMAPGVVSRRTYRGGPPRRSPSTASVHRAAMNNCTPAPPPRGVYLAGPVSARHGCAWSRGAGEGRPSLAGGLIWQVHRDTAARRGTAPLAGWRPPTRAPTAR